MKILVIGSGCREHALIKAFQDEPQVHKIYSLPERSSIEGVEHCVPQFLKDYQKLAGFINSENIDLVVVGPEKPLVEGIGDVLRSCGIKVFGPGSQASQLEGSKIFAKTFMREQNIPTANYELVSSVDETLRATHRFSPPYVLKADGLAGGKGVFICSNRQELKERAGLLFEQKIFGSAGERALLEQFQSGLEMSVFVITNGRDYQILPVARDYKKLCDGNKGANTGGMGGVAPVPVRALLMENIRQKIIEPTLLGLQKRRFSYCGVLYLGLIVVDNQALVLEYNVRFGDPEAQVLLPLLDGAWSPVFYAVAKGDLPILRWKDLYTACVVLASPGYPETVKTGLDIKGDIHHKSADSYFLHGGVAMNRQKQWTTSGGRVLNAVAVGATQNLALQKGYQQLQYISWEGMQYRKDIGS